MRAFSELTEHGRARRLRLLGLQALGEQYGLPDVQLRLVAMHSFNTIFRVDTPGGRFAIRIGDSCRIHQTAVEDTEALWLDRLSSDGFENATIVPTTSGTNWISASTPAVPDPRICTLFTWVEGNQLTNGLTVERVVAAGRMLARLHEHAARLGQRPAALELRDAVYFGDRDLVADHASVHGELFRDATGLVQQMYDDVWRHGGRPHLLHGDFGPHNVLAWRNRLRPIDFQDLRVGFDIQDIGISITDLHRRDPSLVEPFTSGYRQIRSLPELSPNTLATLAAGRSLNIMNLALHAPDSGIGQVFDQHAQRVIDWMTLHRSARC